MRADIPARVIEEGIRQLIFLAGDDPDRPGLDGTPGRVLRAFAEMTDGVGVDGVALLKSALFDDDGYDEMIAVPGIEFVSLCEHHLLPFTGVATVAYLPEVGSGKVVGLSKLARVVQVYAHRLQIQERLTMQIADAIEEALAPEGVGVVLRATHSCMSCRGARQANARMVTSALRGALRNNDSTRAEFFALALGP